MRYFPSASVFACGRSCPCPPKEAERSVTVTSGRPVPCAVTVPAMTPPDLPAAFAGVCAAQTGAQKESARKIMNRRAAPIETSHARLMTASPIELSASHTELTATSHRLVDFATHASALQVKPAAPRPAIQDEQRP